MTGWTAADVARAVGGTLTGGGGERPVLRAVIDSREAAPGDLFCALSGERTDGHAYIARAFDAGAACCLALRVPEGETRPVILVPDVAEALRALARAYRATLSIPVIGVTGSVGKTTAKEMIASVLSRRFPVLRTEKNLNNDLGVPLTLLRIGAEHRAAVVEMGISHFGEMTGLARMVMPTMAVYTVIGRAHLEFLGDRDGVMRAKGELLSVMDPGGTVFVNGDDDRLAALSCRQKKVTFGCSPDCAVRAEEVRVSAESAAFTLCAEGRRIPMEVPAFGGHLVYAALAAGAVGLALGLTDGEIAEGAAAYRPVGRRSRVLRTPSLTLVDDCYNSNPDSCAAAIASAAALGGRLVCVLGDMLELGEDAPALHRAVGGLAREKGALLLTAGELSRFMGGEHFASRAELIAALPRLLKRGDTVLVKASRSMAFEEISEFLTTLEL